MGLLEFSIFYVFAFFFIFEIFYNEQPFLMSKFLYKVMGKLVTSYSNPFVWNIGNEKSCWLSEIGLKLLWKGRIVAIQIHRDLGAQVLCRLCLLLRVWAWVYVITPFGSILSFAQWLGWGRSVTFKVGSVYPVCAWWRSEELQVSRAAVFHTLK